MEAKVTEISVGDTYKYIFESAKGVVATGDFGPRYIKSPNAASLVAWVKNEIDKLQTNSNYCSNLDCTVLHVWYCYPERYRSRIRDYEFVNFTNDDMKLVAALEKCPEGF